MKDLYIILPAQSLDSLSLRGPARDCEEILTAWTAVYHPDILRKTQKTARPLYGLYIYDEPDNAILVTPKATQDVLSEDWKNRAEERGCVFLEDCSDMDTLVKQILEQLSEPEEVLEPVSHPEDSLVVDDFLALGMLHLLSELLSHKLQFMSYLDDFSFSTKVLGALTAWDTSDAKKARLEMQSAWDLLVQSRQYYAPTEGYLLDLTLLAPSVLPEGFLPELEKMSEVNLLADGATIAKMAETQPDLLAAVQTGLETGKVCLLGGEENESELPLLTQEGILRRLLHGLSVYEKYLGARPAIYGRRRYGLTPLLPGILRRLGYTGALHFTLDDGVFPTDEQSRLAWHGLDGDHIESVGRIPYDAQDVSGLGALPEVSAKMYNVDNAPCNVFAHWAGTNTTSRWFALLKHSAAWIPMFGTPSTFASCFSNTKYSSVDRQFTADAYVSPYLAQSAADGETDAISRWARYYQLRARLQALHNLAVFDEILQSTLLTADEKSKSKNRRSGMKSAKKQYRAQMKELRAAQNAASEPASESEDTSLVDEWLDQLDTCAMVSDEFYRNVLEQLPELEAELTRNFAEKISGGRKVMNAAILLNPWSFVANRTLNLSQFQETYQLEKLNPLDEDRVACHIWESTPQGVQHAAAVEVPSAGFAVLTHDPSATTGPESTQAEPEKRFQLPFFHKKEKPLPPPVNQNSETRVWTLANELLMLRFDPYTGHLRSAYDNKHRGSRFSQQISMRMKSVKLDWPGDEEPDEYSVMAADEFTPIIGADANALRVTGRLMARDGKNLARFTQITTLRRNSGIVEIDLDLDPEVFPTKNPWQSYYASRLAWGETACDLFRNVGFATVPTSLRKIEAPLFVDIRPIHYSSTTRLASSVSKEVAQRIRGRVLRDEDFLPERDSNEPTTYADTRLTLISNGLPYHRYIGTRRLDTLLSVRGESARHFRYAVALNQPSPLNSALNFMAPPLETSIGWDTSDASNRAKSGWFAHLSHRNLLVTHWDATSSGVIIRVAETQGRRVSASLQLLRDVKSANQTDFLGENQSALHVQDGKVFFDIPAYGFIEMKLVF